MKKTSLLSGLILVFGLFGRTLQEGTTNGTEPATNTTLEANGTSTGNVTQEGSSPPVAGSPPAADASPSGGGKCKPDEVLSETGCVPKQDFLNKVMMESWKDEKFQKVKELTGVVESTRCKPNEKMTPNGCVAPNDSENLFKYKVPIVSSRLNSEKEVVHGRSSQRFHEDEQSNDDEPVEPKKRKRKELGPPVSGQERPRKYVFLPGRRLRKNDHKCRPYEVRGMKRRCIRRRGRRPKPNKYEKDN